LRVIDFRIKGERKRHWGSGIVTKYCSLVLKVLSLVLFGSKVQSVRARTLYRYPSE
jgi:hypothetical protein